MKVPEAQVLQAKKDMPRLEHAEFLATSPDDGDYNCVAWALHRKDLHFWPARAAFRARSAVTNRVRQVLYWPEDTDEESREVFVRFFSMAVHGYHLLPTPDLSYQPGLDKIALYLWSLDGQVEHVARQLHDPSHPGWWTSKLGSAIDIVHRRAEDLLEERDELVVMARQRRASGWKSPLFPQPRKAR
jgi:hypothetical protein